jgi:hypothetical protein
LLPFGCRIAAGESRRGDRHDVPPRRTHRAIAREEHDAPRLVMRREETGTA